MHQDQERIEELGIALRSSQNEIYEFKCKISNATRTIENLEIDAEDR